MKLKPLAARALTGATLAVTLLATPAVAMPPGNNFPAPTMRTMYDANQKTHYTGKTLIIGTYGHALAACQNPRFTKPANYRNCVSSAYTWARRTHQNTNTGPTTLPTK